MEPKPGDASLQVGQHMDSCLASLDPMINDTLFDVSRNFMVQASKVRSAFSVRKSTITATVRTLATVGLGEPEREATGPAF